MISIFTLDETLRQVPSSGERDVNEAVGQAREGFRSWSKLSGFERGNVLKRAANIMRVRSTTAQLLLDVLLCYLNDVISADARCQLIAIFYQRITVAILKLLINLIFIMIN